MVSTDVGDPSSCSPKEYIRTRGPSRCVIWDVLQPPPAIWIATISLMLLFLLDDSLVKSIDKEIRSPVIDGM